MANSISPQDVFLRALAMLLPEAIAIRIFKGSEVHLLAVQVVSKKAAETTLFYPVLDEEREALNVKTLTQLFEAVHKQGDVQASEITSVSSESEGSPVFVFETLAAVPKSGRWLIPLIDSSSPQHYILFAIDYDLAEKVIAAGLYDSVRMSPRLVKDQSQGLSLALNLFSARDDPYYDPIKVSDFFCTYFGGEENVVPVYLMLARISSALDQEENGVFFGRLVCAFSSDQIDIAKNNKEARQFLDVQCDSERVLQLQQNALLQTFKNFFERFFPELLQAIKTVSVLDSSERDKQERVDGEYHGL